VYLPACINRIYGGADRNAPSVVEALVTASERAGKPVWIPDDAAGHCCGTPWTSKGHPEAHAWMARKTADALLRWTGGGELPVVIDASSCAGGLLHELPGALDEARAERFGAVQVLDSVAWAFDHLLPALDVRRAGSVAVHPTCSTRHLGMTVKLQRLAEALGEDVYTPPSAFCCGFAGDRGMLHPELTRSATGPEADEIRARSFDAHVSSNRTCEIGLTAGTGRPYVSVMQLLEERSRPA
jgi:D-lactate dehydrogenase